jgi:hypothetical protein
LLSTDHATHARAQWHDVLLRLAGWLADEDLAQARDLLARNRLDGVAQVIAEAIDTGLVPYSPNDASRLRQLLAPYNDDPTLVDAGIRQDLEDPPCEFAPVPPWGIGPSTIDDIDRAAVTAATGAGVTRLWRAWRYPATGLQSPRRIYLAETPADIDPVKVAGRLQEGLIRAGEAAPQVETYTAETRLPRYHRSALSEAEALWSVPANNS